MGLNDTMKVFGRFIEMFETVRRYFEGETYKIEVINRATTSMRSILMCIYRMENIFTDLDSSRL